MIIEIRPLSPDDDRAQFSSGDAALDAFFHRYAGQNQFKHHIGVSYVAVAADHILGFVTVSPATLSAEELPDGRSLPPYPIPVLRVARLAVAKSAQGQGLGAGLLRFAEALTGRLSERTPSVPLFLSLASVPKHRAP